MGTEPRTLCDIFSVAASSGKPNLLISKVGGVWSPISAADFGFTVRALSLGLNGLGVQPGDRVAILSENRPEWAMADYAILCAGAWSVPIYPDAPGRPDRPAPQRLRREGIFVSSLEQLGKILTIKAQCPTLDHVILIEGNPPGEPGYPTFHAVVDQGRPTLEMSPDVFEQRAARVKPDGRRDDHLHVGHDRGAEGRDAHALEHRLERRDRLRGRPVHGGATSRSRSSRSRTSSSGWSTTAYLYTAARRSPTPSRSTSVAANFLEVNPHCFGAVPRVYEKVHAQDPGERPTPAADQEEDLRLGAWPWRGRAARTKSGRRAAAPGARAQGALADALVFTKIRHALGGRLRFAVSGGAPLSRDLAEFFWGAGVTIFEGYGLTETSPVIARQQAGRWRLGTVGQPIAGRRGQDRRRRRDPDARSARHEGLLQQARGDGARRSTPRAGSTPATSATLDGRLPRDHRPEEGHHRDRRRQEHRAAADRERAQEATVRRAARSSSATGRSSWPR